MSYYVYPAIFEPDADALKVTFPDLSEVITCGWGIEEALAMATLQDALKEKLGV
jgi:predicted RNase H-like HicB family nuclease